LHVARFGASFCQMVCKKNQAATLTS
jgi:hypothetical protein